MDRKSSASRTASRSVSARSSASSKARWAARTSSVIVILLISVSPWGHDLGLAGNALPHRHRRAAGAGEHLIVAERHREAAGGERVGRVHQLDVQVRLHGGYRVAILADPM